jgi:adenylate kinase
MNNMNTIYVFLGLPASGKGTQAEILAKKENIKIVGAGDLVRETMAGAPVDPFVAEIKKRYDAGIPQPDEVMIDLVKRYLDSLQQSVILDNFPFSLKQADFLENFIKDSKSMWQGPRIIYINLDPEVAIKRAISRKVCTSCGMIYGPTDEMICEKCGGSLVVRSDDNEETMRTRISHYLPRLSELIAYYKEKKADLIEIDGSKSIAEVTDLINKEL